MPHKKEVEWGLKGAIITLVLVLLGAYFGALDDERRLGIPFQVTFTFLFVFGIVFLCPLGFLFGWLWADEAEI